MFSVEPDIQSVHNVSARLFRETCERIVKDNLPLSIREYGFFSDCFEFDISWQPSPRCGWIVAMYACWHPERVHGWPDSMQPKKYRKLVASSFPRKTYESAYRFMCSL